MFEPPVFPDEFSRLGVLRDLQILDTAPDPDLDQIARVAARVAQAPIALISLVDSNRQWFKAKCGLDLGETPRTISFSAHALGGTGPSIVPDALEDERFRNNPLVVGAPNIRFYVGFPLTLEGMPLGTLCIIDRVPRVLTVRQMRQLASLARQVEVQLEFRRNLKKPSLPVALPAKSLPETEPGPPRDMPARPAVDTPPIAADPKVGDMLGWGLDSVVILNADATIRYQSESITDVFGYAPEELVGQNAFELVHPDDREEMLAEFAKSLSEPGASDRRRYRYQHKDQTWRPVESVSRNMMGDPSIQGILVQTRDMTPWVKAELALSEARAEAQTLAESHRRLDDDLRRLQGTKEQLAGLIVHDLKSPLTAIIGNAEFALEEARDAGVAVDAIDDIIQSALMLQRMVIDLLDVSRSESGSLVAKLKSTDPIELIERACAGVSGILRGSDQTVSCEAQRPTLPLDLDPNLVERILQNLLDNSSKYSPPGTQLVVRLSERGECVRIEVLDQGPGVPDPYKEKVFELYAQVEPDAEKHARASRGLGLAFCKLAVESHRGRIWVEDRPEGGSCFCVEIPRNLRATANALL